MKAGPMRQQIELQSLVAPGSETRDKMGQPIKNFQTFLTVFAAIEPLRGNEFFSAQQVQSDTRTRIRIRWNDDARITTKMRVKHGEHYYDVTEIIRVVEGRREMQIMATERHQAGFRA